MSKAEKLPRRIQQLLANILHQEMSDPRIQFASVTKVKLSKDKRYCTAYISVLGSPSEQRTVMRGIQHARGYVQKTLGSRLALRYIPILTFEQDFSIEKSIAVNQLLKETIVDPSNIDESRELVESKESMESTESKELEESTEPKESTESTT